MSFCLSIFAGLQSNTKSSQTPRRTDGRCPRASDETERTLGRGRRNATDAGAAGSFCWANPRGCTAADPFG